MRSIVWLLLLGIGLTLVILSGPWFVGYPVWASVPMSFALGAFVAKGTIGFSEDINNG